MAGEKVSSNYFMNGVNSTAGNIFTKIVEQMPAVVKERGRDEIRLFTLKVSYHRCLQGMLKFCHLLTIAPMAKAKILVKYGIDNRSLRVHHWSGFSIDRNSA